MITIQAIRIKNVFPITKNNHYWEFYIPVGSKIMLLSHQLFELPLGYKMNIPENIVGKIYLNDKLYERGIIQSNGIHILTSQSNNKEIILKLMNISGSSVNIENFEPIAHIMFEKTETDIILEIED